MNDRSLAIRYSKALFELAAEEKLELAAESELQNFSAFLDQNPSLSLLFRNPLIPFEKKKEMLGQAAKTGLIPISRLVIEFLALVIARGRFVMLELIIKTYHELLNSSRHFEEVTITTARPLKPELKNRLEQLLEKKMGEKIITETKVEPALIGGIQVQIRNRLFDGSIRSKLDNLKMQLVSI